MHDELAFLNISKYIIINDNVLVQRQMLMIEKFRFELIIQKLFDCRKTYVLSMFSNEY